MAPTFLTQEADARGRHIHRTPEGRSQYHQAQETSHLLDLQGDLYSHQLQSLPPDGTQPILDMN